MHKPFCPGYRIYIMLVYNGLVEVKPVILIRLFLKSNSPTIGLFLYICNMYCISCKEDKVFPNDYIERDTPKTEEELLWLDYKQKDGNFVTIDSINTDNGIINTISAGYGSSHDGDTFIIGICDECIRENVDKGILLYKGNYIYRFYDSVKEDIEKSKTIFRRNKNLDKLT